MKKNIYTLITIITIFLFNINLKAAVPDNYKYYCSYNTTIINGKASVPLTFYVFENDAKLYYKNNVLKSGNVNFSELNTNILFNFNASKFYSIAKVNEKCPVIYIQLPTANQNYYTLDYSYGDYSVSGSEKIYNSNLSEEDKNEINSNQITTVYECANRYYIDQDYIKGANLGGRVSFTFLIKSDGKKYVKIFKNDSEYRTYLYGDTITINEQILRFRTEDESFFFSQNSSQINNNTFSCPSLSNVAVGYVDGEYLVSKKSTIEEESEYDFSSSTVTADELDSRDGSNSKSNISIGKYNKSTDTCYFLLGGGTKENPPALVSYLQIAYTIVKVASILLLIVFSMLDLSNVITSDKDILMKSIKKWVNRLVILIIILLLPTFIDIIGNLVGYEDILCGIR